MCTYICMYAYTNMGCLRLVGSKKLLVSFAKESYKRDDILQKRPVILSILLTVATPDLDSKTELKSSWFASHTFAYTHIHICEHIFIQIHIHTCIHWHLDSRARTHMHTHEYRHTHTYTHIHTHTHGIECRFYQVNVFRHIYVYMYLQLYICILIQLQINTCIYIQLYTYPNKCAM